MLCYVMLCYVMLCYVMLCYVMLNGSQHSVAESCSTLLLYNKTKSIIAKNICNNSHAYDFKRGERKAGQIEGLRHLK
jgi:hypothetical protein